jgi:flavin-dependent dehydrogenase
MHDKSLTPSTWATIDIARTDSGPWQAVVVGAGPAGALAARELARRDFRVLLVDKAKFPRYKVCGGFLGAAALALLRECGLADLLERLGACPTTTLRIYAGERQAQVQLSAGYSISRETLDTALVEEAIAAGAEFIDGTTARTSGDAEQVRMVSLRQGTHRANIETHLLLAADGLTGKLLQDDKERFAPTIDPQARIGVGAIFDSPDAEFAPGTIHMIYGAGGYLGLVRLEDGRLNAAAAFNADYVRSAGGPAQAAARHLSEAGLPQPAAMMHQHFCGTPALTRVRRHLSGSRLLALGDATGYIEPFTGEGMTWALMSARAVAPIAAAAIEQWRPEIGGVWERCHRHKIRRRQRACRIITALLRRPGMSRATVGLLARMPWLARPAVRSVEKELKFAG